MLGRPGRLVGMAQCALCRVHYTGHTVRRHAPQHRGLLGPEGTTGENQAVGWLGSDIRCSRFRVRQHIKMLGMGRKGTERKKKKKECSRWCRKKKKETEITADVGARPMDGFRGIRVGEVQTLGPYSVGGATSSSGGMAPARQDKAGQREHGERAQGEGVGSEDHQNEAGVKGNAPKRKVQRPCGVGR